MSRVAAAVLAAGASRRLGRPKALVEVDGRPLVRRAVEAAREARCDLVVVVVGPAADRIRAAAGDGCDFVVNPDPERGMASSIGVAVDAIAGRDPRVGGLVILVCDQPALDADVLRRLMAAWGGDRGGVAAARYRGVRGVPALFGRDTWSTLRGLEGDRGARDWLRDPARPVVEISWPEGDRDVDRPSDLPSPPGR